MDMSRDIEQRLYLFLSTHGYHSGFRLQRIALNLDQIDQYQPPPNPAKITDARFAKYQEEYGDESWELDALPPDVLTTLITDAVASIRDADRWDEEVDSENEERADIAHAAKHWPSVTTYLSTLDRDSEGDDE
jgi:hypothetical protein